MKRKLVIKLKFSVWTLRLRASGFLGATYPLKQIHLKTDLFNSTGSPWFKLLGCCIQVNVTLPGSLQISSEQSPSQPLSLLWGSGPDTFISDFNNPYLTPGSILLPSLQNSENRHPSWTRAVTISLLFVMPFMTTSSLCGSFWMQTREYPKLLFSEILETPRSLAGVEKYVESHLPGQSHWRHFPAFPHRLVK